MSIKDDVSAVAEVLKAVSSDPNFKAAGQELGMAAHTAAKLVNNALLPLAVVNYGFEKARVYFEKHFQRDMAAKLEHLQAELAEPRASIAGPAIQALAFAQGEPDLKELYLNLLAHEMSSETQRANHPGFVEIIRQLTAEEARMFRAFMLKLEAILVIMDLGGRWKIDGKQLAEWLSHLGENVDHERAVMTLENWIRLGLCRVDTDLSSVRDQVESFVKTQLRREDYIISLESDTEMLSVIVTGYGRQFARAVGIEESSKPPTG